MKKIDTFINKYSLSKTLRFSLIPIGKTEDYFDVRKLLEEDKQRAEAFKSVKGYIDRYHIAFIEKTLQGFDLPSELLHDYAALYYKPDKSDKEKKAMDDYAQKMRRYISIAFTGSEEYKTIFSDKVLKSILPDFLTEESELENVNKLKNFYTYFQSYEKNRENIYAPDNKVSIACRTIDENLPMFLDNCKSFEKIQKHLPQESLAKLNDDFAEIYGIKAEDLFVTETFGRVLSQSGIDMYNSFVGGYTCSDGTKIKGLNEHINLFNQQNGKELRLPKIKPLYKQILSERESVSFIPEKFSSDDEVIDSVNDFYTSAISNVLKDIVELFEDFTPDGVYLASKSINEISSKVFGSYAAVYEGWKKEYCAENKLPKKGKTLEYYADKINTAYKKIQSMSLVDVWRFGKNTGSSDNAVTAEQYFKETVNKFVKAIQDSYSEASSLLTNKYTQGNGKKLVKNDDAIAKIKKLLDSIKDLEKALKPLLGTGKEEAKNEVFYGSFTECYTAISEIDRLYDKVRNYITQKPYSTEKIKLNFNNSQLLGGWDRNKESDYRTVLLTKDGSYYLAIMNEGYSKAFADPPADGDCYKKMEYKLLPGPNKMLPKVFFAERNLEQCSPDEEILRIKESESFKKGANFNLDDCHKLIDFYKASIAKHEDWSKFGFVFTPTEQYKDISEFYNEVKKQGYYIKFRDVSSSYIDALVDEGKVYLFKIYNKDFSEYSHGAPNIHTLYFKMLFDERNLADVVYQLNGGGEMFYREASINDKEKIVHHKNEPIDNKNRDNPKRTSTFPYDITKDKRFTERQFALHTPITLNFKADGKDFINNDVRSAIKKSDENYIIGIDRGERNLLYICVIDNDGRIIEQKSLNVISDGVHTVDYHKLLDGKEAERDEARKKWTTIESIKELKEGYLSRAVHEICKLVVKYDAIIAMEDLNFGFKNGRFKIEKQVYQKFENMLINKLNYLVTTKDCNDAEKLGGLLNAYQLTNKDTGVKDRGKQDGFIFYVPAELTSKIDPTTGFVDLLHPKYTSVEDTVKFIESIDAIRFNSDDGVFEFDVNYDNFPKCNASYRKKWTLCSYGDRIRTFRNPQKNNEWDNETVVLTEEFKRLFAGHGVDIGGDIKNQLLQIKQKEFLSGFMRLFELMLQMRNSKTGDVDVDYLISPVRGSDGKFFDSRNSGEQLPKNADANGAYNIARKALWAVSVLKNTDDDMLGKANLLIKRADWLEFAQVKCNE